MLQRVVNQLRKMPGSPDRLERDSFELRNGEAGSRELIASYKAPKPLVLRGDKPVKVTVTALEEFTSDGSGAQTFELSNEFIDAPNTQNIVVYADGERVKPESVDYDANSFDYDDNGEAADVAAFYVARDPLEFEIEKQAPQSQGSASEVIFDEPTSLLHVRDQNEQPRYFDVGQSPLHPVVPEKWRINVYAKGPYAASFFGETGENDGAKAVNALLSLPYKQGRGSIDGLGKAVAHDIVDRS